MPRLPLLLLVIGLFAAGCAPRPLVVAQPPGEEVPAEFPGHTAEQIRNNIWQTARPVESFRSEARIELRMPEENVRGTSTIYERGDSLLMVVRGPLGVEVARALATPDSFFLHDRVQNVLFFGPAAAAERYFPGAGSPEELMAGVLGLVEPGPETPWRVRADDRYYYLDSPDRTETYTVDPAIWRVIRYELRSAAEQRLELREYSAFDVIEGVALARRVVLDSPATGAGMTLEHVRLTVNPDNPPIRFSPTGATRRPLG
jgi:hypothetical protein